jgi:hypothetical protein
VRLGEDNEPLIPVHIDDIRHGVWGSIADARASTDLNQEIGCQVSTTPFGSGLYWSAVDALGNRVWCESRGLFGGQI